MTKDEIIEKLEWLEDAVDLLAERAGINLDKELGSGEPDADDADDADDEVDVIEGEIVA